MMFDGTYRRGGRLLTFFVFLMGALALAFSGTAASAADEGEADADQQGNTPLMGARFLEGTHFEALPVRVDTRNPEKVEVVELFSYACIHCNNFEPYVKSWQQQQPDDVDFRPVPAVFDRDWELLAQVFYTAETLGVTEAVHQDIFNGIHQRREDLRRQEAAAALFAERAGVTQDDFDAAYGSFSVRSRVQQAKALVRAYRATGVPAMVVNGKYIVDGRMAGGNAAMLEVVDFLVAQERATLSSEASTAQR